MCLARVEQRVRQQLLEGGRVHALLRRRARLETSQQRFASRRGLSMGRVDPSAGLVAQLIENSARISVSLALRVVRLGRTLRSVVAPAGSRSCDSPRGGAADTTGGAMPSAELPAGPTRSGVGPTAVVSAPAALSSGVLTAARAPRGGISQSLAMFLIPNRKELSK